MNIVITTILKLSLRWVYSPLLNQKIGNRNRNLRVVNSEPTR